MYVRVGLAENAVFGWVKADEQGSATDWIRCDIAAANQNGNALSGRRSIGA